MFNSYSGGWRRLGTVLLANAALAGLAWSAVAQESTPPTPSKSSPGTPPEMPADADAEELKKVEKPTVEKSANDSKGEQNPTATPPKTSAKPVPSTDAPSENNSDEEQSSVKKPAKSLTESLQDQLLGKAQTQLENPVELILERMRSVQERLVKTTTDKETRQEQAQIVQEIDQLIEALKNQKPPPPQSSSSNSENPPPPPMGSNPDENQPAQGTPQPRPRNSQKQQGGKSEQKEKQQSQKQQQPGQTESVSDKARDSNSSTGKRPRSPEEEAARQRMAKDVWGHLPPGVRQELLNIFSEKYIPKYDDQVRRYYEALAEENRAD